MYSGKNGFQTICFSLRRLVMEKTTTTTTTRKQEINKQQRLHSENENKTLKKPLKIIKMHKKKYLEITKLFFDIF